MTFGVPVTFLDLRAALRERTQLDVNDPRALDPVLNTLINAAWHRFQIANPHGWPWDFAEMTVALPAGTDSLPFVIGGAAAGALTRIRYVVLQHTSGLWEYPLERVTRADQLGRYPKDSETGAPRTFALLGNPALVANATAMSMFLRPHPDIAYNVMVGADAPAPDLVADADPAPATNDYAISEFSDLLIDYSASLVFRARQDLAEALLGASQDFDASVLTLRRTARLHVGPGRGQLPVADDQELG